MNYEQGWLLQRMTLWVKALCWVFLMMKCYFKNTSFCLLQWPTYIINSFVCLYYFYKRYLHFDEPKVFIYFFLKIIIFVPNPILHTLKAVFLPLVCSHDWFLAELFVTMSSQCWKYQAFWLIKNLWSSLTQSWLGKWNYSYHMEYYISMITKQLKVVGLQG